MVRSKSRCVPRQGGFTYVGLLFGVALAGISLAGTGVLWKMEGLREKEKELLFNGEAYRQAIASYYDKSPGSDKQYPLKLDDLILDKRFPNPVRHLRRLYRDPMVADGEWALILQQGQIVGVASQSSGKPIKVAGFAAGQESFSGAEHYFQWRFLHGGGG